MVLTNKNGGDAVTQTNALFINSQLVSAKTGRHQVILEEIHEWW
jgi:hypothetical protein